MRPHYWVSFFLVLLLEFLMPLASTQKKFLNHFVIMMKAQWVSDLRPPWSTISLSGRREGEFTSFVRLLSPVPKQSTHPKRRFDHALCPQPVVLLYPTLSEKKRIYNQPALDLQPTLALLSPIAFVWDELPALSRAGSRYRIRERPPCFPNSRLWRLHFPSLTT